MALSPTSHLRGLIDASEVSLIDSLLLREQNHTNEKQIRVRKGLKIVEEIENFETVHLKYFKGIKNYLTLDHLKKIIKFYPCQKIRIGMKTKGILYVNHIFFPLFEEGYLNKSPLLLEELCLKDQISKRNNDESEEMIQDLKIDLILYYSLVYQSLYYFQSETNFSHKLMSLLVATIILNEAFNEAKKSQESYGIDMSYEEICHTIVKPLLEQFPSFVEEILKEKKENKGHLEGVDFIINRLLKGEKVTQESLLIRKKMAKNVLKNQININLDPFHEKGHLSSKQRYIIFFHSLSIFLMIIALWFLPQEMMFKKFVLSVAILSTIIFVLRSLIDTKVKGVKNKIAHLFYFNKKKSVGIHLFILSLFQLFFSTLVLKFFINEGFIHILISSILFLITLFHFFKILICELKIGLTRMIKLRKKHQKKFLYHPTVLKKVTFKRIMWSLRVNMKKSSINFRSQIASYRWHGVSLFIFIVTLLFCTVLLQYGQVYGVYIFFVPLMLSALLLLIRYFKKGFDQLYKVYIKWKAHREIIYLKFLKVNRFQQTHFNLLNLLKSTKEDGFIKNIKNISYIYFIFNFIIMLVISMLFLTDTYSINDLIIRILKYTNYFFTTILYFYIAIIMIIGCFKYVIKDEKEKEKATEVFLGTQVIPIGVLFVLFTVEVLVEHFIKIKVREELGMLLMFFVVINWYLASILAIIRMWIYYFKNKYFKIEKKTKNMSHKQKEKKGEIKLLSYTFLEDRFLRSCCSNKGEVSMNLKEEIIVNKDFKWPQSRSYYRRWTTEDQNEPILLKCHMFDPEKREEIQKVRNFKGSVIKNEEDGKVRINPISETFVQIKQITPLGSKRVLIKV